MKGFILQPTYRIESGRPVVHLYGRLESGDPFLVRDDSLVPHFFIKATDAPRARELGAHRIRATDLKTMAGEPVARVEVATPPDTPPLRDRLTAQGIPAHEADVRFDMRFLIDQGIKGSVEIEPVAPVARTGGRSGGSGPGPSGLPGIAPARESTPAGVVGEPGKEGGAPLWVYERPILAPCEWTPSLSVLAFDIETDPRGRHVYALSLHGEGIAEVLYVPPQGARASIAKMEEAIARARATDGEEAPARGAPSRPVSYRATPCDGESDLIRTFAARVATHDPDILTGWNVIDFDLRVLDAISRRLGVRLQLGRSGEHVRLRLEQSARVSSHADVAGRVVMDGIDLLRGAFVRLEDYTLETAARTILGEGKLIAGRDRAEEIDRLYHEDLPRFLDYSLNDSRLVTGILKATGVVDLAVRRSLLTGMPPDRVGASIASFDSLYLHELRKRGCVAPSVGAVEALEETMGGAVLEPVTGFHENVLLFDFRSLYPSLIRTYNIDPLGLIQDGPEGKGAAQPGGEVRSGTEGAKPEAGGAPIVAPNGARFRREPGILPGLLDRLFGERAAAKARGDAIASQAIKILMNSCYGVLATPACRFYSVAVANAITGFGQATLMRTKSRAEELGYEVIYGDTDSLFVAAGTEVAAEARARGERLRETLNRELAERIREEYGLRSHLELEFQRLYKRLFLPSVRHGTTGARKRYAGLVEEGGRETVHFVGMEIVRRDWTDLSKIFQRGLFERVFRDEEVGPYICGFVEELREGKHDAHLVYRKALRKRISEYIATTPPHVKAARLMGGRVGRIIDYVMTTAGPEPATMRRGSFDYDHYVEKQIRPVAETVLSHLGLDFDRILGKPGAATQLNLF
jgi:DNA polymerase-2